jgi:CRISPR-associated exonuclease Cas4
MARVLRHRRLGGLPVGEVVLSDTEDEFCPVLVSHRYGLKGKPDAIVRTKSGDYIPVERKSRYAPPKGPRDHDLIQLVAYFLLIEDHYGQPPSTMRLQYADRSFDIAFTPDHRDWALAVIADMRRAQTSPDCARSHNIAPKCRHCGLRQNCSQAL